MKRSLDTGLFRARQDEELVAALSKGTKTQHPLELPSIDRVELAVLATVKAEDLPEWIRIHRAADGTVHVGREVSYFAKAEITKVQTKRGVEVRIRFNPNRVLDPTGWRLHPYSDGLAVIEAVANWLAKTMGGDPAKVRINRLDLTRDMECWSCPSFYVESLRGHRRSGQHTAVRYGVVAAETAMAGNLSGRVMGYNKDAERKVPTSRGENILRLEAQLFRHSKGGWITGAGLDVSTRHAGVFGVDDLGHVLTCDLPNGGPVFEPDVVFDQLAHWYGADLVFLTLDALLAYLLARGVRPDRAERFVDLAGRRLRLSSNDTAFVDRIVRRYGCWPVGGNVFGPTRSSVGGVIRATGDLPEHGWEAFPIFPHQIGLLAELMSEPFSPISSTVIDVA